MQTNSTQPRKDYIRKERRQRSGDNVIGKRLAVNTDKLDLQKFKYRWLNANEARIHFMTVTGDWQLMHEDGTGLRDDERKPDMGTLLSTVVGVTPAGAPIRAYLARKPREWWEQDQMKKQTDLDKQLENLRRAENQLANKEADYAGAIHVPGAVT